MPEKLLSEVRFEIEQIDALLESYADLLDHVKAREPDLVETTAVASVLHSFYNGIENIFLRISKECGESVPDGDRWHRDLLTRMTGPAAGRAAVISTDLAQELAEYLGFRHFYRHSYSFFLDWVEMAELVGALRDTWSRVRSSLTRFCESLDA